MPVPLKPPPVRLWQDPLEMAKNMGAIASL